MQFHARPVRFLTVLVLLAVTNVYVFASGAVTSKTSEVGSPKMLLGKLITNSNRPILVNGGEAITGAVILSGARLVTPLVGGATVQLDKLGTINIAPKSDVTLTFNEKSVTARVASGNAAITTVEGVSGVVVGPNGAAVPATPPVPTDADTARNWGIAGVAVGSAAFVWALIAWNKANDADDRAAALEAQLAALRACLAGQSVSPVRVCTSF